MDTELLNHHSFELLKMLTESTSNISIGKRVNGKYVSNNPEVIKKEEDSSRQSSVSYKTSPGKLSQDRQKAIKYLTGGRGPEKKSADS